ncbi:XRE family transcriptional regulator [Enterococcus faecalis]|uniref:XRE family transcriptional regulator n=1 Tax=Enterococcus faecalis TaxID=1351 RepID=UPI00287FEF4A|nr:XRE family transcriptional regulator [Enterococcus faecalis]
MIVDTDKIEWLLENRSQYFISKETGIAQSRLSKLKNNFSEIGKSSIDVGVKLTDLAMKEKNKPATHNE